MRYYQYKWRQQKDFYIHQAARVRTYSLKSDRQKGRSVMIQKVNEPFLVFIRHAETTSRIR